MTRPAITGTAPAQRVSGAPPAESEIAPTRLRVQRVAAPRPAAPEEIVGWLGAMQAQEYAVAKWSIGMRSAGLTESEVDAALAEGRILRTHVLRPTWHFVRREDIRWLLTATAPRVRSALAYYDRLLELDGALYARSNDVIARAVGDGRHRTRAELADALASAGIEAKGQRLGHIVMRAELDAIVCSGIPRGKQNTYALVSERASDAAELDSEEALAELTLRYFSSHGPATDKDFRWWASLSAAEARRGLDMVEGRLERLHGGERTYWWDPSAVHRDPDPGTSNPAVHLMQGYDEYIVGYSESRNLIDRATLANGSQAWNRFHSAVVLDGQVVGHWRRREERGRTTIEIQLLRRLGRADRRALEEAVERYSRFTGRAAEWVA